MTGKKVLIVDDDPSIISTLSKLFKDGGASVETALSYEEGLTALRTVKPDAAVVDLMLPQHSGLELIKEARDQSKDTFFVILTNSVNAEHIAEAMESNVTTFIQKADHDPSEIVAMVSNHFKS